ncbi:MAG: hypothetical protein H7Y86_16030 [Rhizobacter sp.]|nr:hypothetical protein [Ferruginibacter sp.]
MKKHLFFLMTLLCLGMMTLFSGCSKDDPKPTCRIITITPNAGTANNISYNTEGKISNITTGNTVTTYAYSGNNAVATTTTSGTFDSKRIITSNSNGLTINMRTENDMAGTSWSNLAFEYSGTELIKQTSTSSSGGTPDITTVTWTGGNPTTITSGANVQTVEYYTDKPSQTGDYWDIAQTLQGYRIIKAKNPIKSLFAGGSISNLDYVFDGDGKIITLNATGASNITYNYQHQCN